MTNIDKKLNPNTTDELFPIKENFSIAFNLNNLNNYVDVLRHGIFNLTTLVAQYDKILGDNKIFTENFYKKLINIKETHIAGLDKVLADLMNSVYKQLNNSKDEIINQNKDLNDSKDEIISQNEDIEDNKTTDENIQTPIENPEIGETE